MQAAYESLISCRVIYERNRTGFEEFKEFQAKLGSVIAGRYIVESVLGQAAFSKALKCYDTEAKQHVSASEQFFSTEAVVAHVSFSCFIF